MFSKISLIDMLVKFYLVITVIILIYCILKEREEFGCTKVTIKKQCDETKSVYFKNSIPNPTDTKTVLEYKLLKLLSLYEFSGVWKKCYIISTIICVFIKLITNVSNINLISLHLIVSAIIYFYHNFMIYHVFRHAKQIGTGIIIKLRDIDKK